MPTKPARHPVLFLAVMLVFALSRPAAAVQPAGTEADHDQLRELLAVFTEGINKGDFAEVSPYLHEPFSGTAISQHFMGSPEDIQAYFDEILRKPDAILKRITIEPEVDELTEIYEGTFGVARGANKEVYELNDGRVFEMTARWTATVVKDSDQWKLLAIHAGANILDNPILSGVEQLTKVYGAVGAAGGVVVGGLLGFFFGRRRKPA